MLFNRIINDIIDWVRRLLHWKRRSLSNKPYSIIEICVCDYGILKLVYRDTLRAVWTYVFSPKNYPSTNVIKDIFDYHICLDHLYTIKSDTVDKYKDTKQSKEFDILLSKLEATSLKSRNKYNPAYTHAVTILKASKWLDGAGNYKTEIIYHNTFNFIGTDLTGYRDKYALPVFKDAVFQLKTRLFEEINWDKELNDSQKRFMGSYYIETKDLLTTKAKANDRNIRQKI